MISIRFYLRGKEKGLKARFKFSKFDSNKQFRLTAIVSTVLFIGIGGYIFYNIKVLNKMTSNKELEVLQAGFEKRIMYGTDLLVWPKLLETSIGVIENANYLSFDQKRDIFFNNAVRFFRLDESKLK